MNKDVLRPKTSNHWETPRKFFEVLNNEFQFKWDICAEEFNTKCPRYFTPENSCLDNEWDKTGWLFINPPYKPLKPFIEKCHREAAKGCRIVALVPLSTIANKYFNDAHVTEVRLIKGRMSFEVNGSEVKDSNSNARHNSCLVIYDKERAESKRFTYLDF